MSNKISVELFCKNYKAQSKGNAKTFSDFLKKHIVRDYVPYVEKDAICTGIVQATTHTMDGSREFIKINSSGRYLLFVIRLIEIYTDIEIDFKDGKYVEQYDELKKIGAIDMLINGNQDSKVEYIPHDEYTEFSTLLNMKLDDFIANEYSVAALLYNLKQSINLSEEVITNAIDSIKENKE